MADAFAHIPDDFTADPVRLHACASNALSLAQLELRSSTTCYTLVENRLKSALDAVMALGSLTVHQLNGSAA